MTATRITIEQGKRLKQARINAGFRSARDAALQHDWKESSYRAHENGTRTIGLDDAERYARSYQSSAVWILHGIGGPENGLSTEVLSALGNLRGDHLARAADMILMLNLMQESGVDVPPSPDIRHKAERLALPSPTRTPAAEKRAIRR